jgi:hypothetical protein
MFDFESISDEPLSESFEAVGYGNIMIVNNMGSLYIISIFYFGITLLLSIIPYCFYTGPCRFYIRRKIQNYLDNFYWNGFIQFIDQNYLFFVVMSMIELFDLRLGSEFTVTERYNSVFAILMIVFLALFPFIIAIVYKCKVRAAVPLPDLEDTMQLETIKYLYRSGDIKWIQNNIYFVSQHAQFMRRYGCLLQKINMARIGVDRAIIAACLPNLRKLAFACIVMLLIDSPILCLILLNYLTLAYLLFILYNKVYTE